MGYPGTVKSKAKKAAAPKRAAKPAAKSAPKSAVAAAAARPGRPMRGSDKELDTIESEMTAAPGKKRLEEWVQVDCPYCGEGVEVHATSEEDGQTMYEDCTVCCRPIALHVTVEDDELQVEAQRS